MHSRVAAFAFALILCSADVFASDAVPAHPRIAWQDAQKMLIQARLKSRQRRFTETLALLAQSRDQLQAIKSKWRMYRRKQIASVLHEVHEERANAYRQVAEKGLVEYRGRFYSFEQMQQLLEFQQQRSLKWLELLKAQEENRRLRTEKMVEEESKRPGEKRNAQSKNVLKDQRRLDDEQGIKIQKRENEQRP